MSHTVNFKTLKFANFLRFGNEEIRMDFEKGVIGLMGDNGIGKSSIIDAICICLFNESCRKSTQDEWTNNLNGKGLYFIMDIERCESVTDVYTIVRKPTVRKTAERLAIYKNGTLLTSLQNPQEYIENTILGFGVNIFKNSIAVSGGTPFISMTPEEKRKFSENLFSIKQVRNYKKIASEKLSDIQLNGRMAEQAILSAKSQISEFTRVLSMADNSVESQVADIDNEIRGFDDTLDKYRREMANSEAQIVDLESQVAESMVEIEKLRLKLAGLGASDLQKKIAIVSATLEAHKRDYKNAKNESIRIAPNVICNHCGNSYSEAQAEEHKAKHEARAAEIADLGKSTKAELTALEARLPEIEAVNSLIAEWNNHGSQLNSAIYGLRSTIKSTASYISNIENARARAAIRRENLLKESNNTDVKAFAQSSIEKAELVIAEKISEKAVCDRKISALKYIVDMCSDDGIKKLLLAEFMPLLNKLIASYLDKFDLPIKIEFDEYFNHKMSAPKGLGQRHSMMSKGQKTRINLAILFAIVDLIKKMGSVRCNLLILDEFADEGLDANGFVAAVNSIRRVSDRDEKSIVLITHKKEDVLYDNLDSLYEVELKNSFATLKQVTSF